MLGRLALGAAIATCLSMPACGGGEERSVEDSVKAVYDAFAVEDAQRACAAMTAEARRAIARPGRSCEQTLGAVFQAPGQRATGKSGIRVTDVSIHGETAEADVVLRGVRSNVGLAKEDGEWRVDRLPGGAG